MKKISDEILNKYLDNELTNAEINELKDYLSDHPEEAEKFNAHQLVDNVLREMEHDSAPENFTYNFMQKISGVINSKPQKNYFIRFVFAFLGLGFIGIFTFGLTNLSTSESSTSDRIFDRIGEGINNLIPNIDSFNFSINSDLLMLIVSTLILVTLVATYGFINSHKAFKSKIENLSH